MMSALFLVLGIFTGCLFSLVVGKLMLFDFTGQYANMKALELAASVAVNATANPCF